MSTSKSKADPHGPNRFDRYVSIHETCLDDFVEEGFVHGDTLDIDATPPEVTIRGNIACSGRIVIGVEKYLEIVEPGADPLVQTYQYSYNVSVQGMGNVFRYDNAHGEDYDDDPARQRTHWHHKHTYEYPPRKGSGRGTVQSVDASDWPHLSDVIREAADWYYEHSDDLPSGPADLSRCRGFQGQE